MGIFRVDLTALLNNLKRVINPSPEPPPKELAEYHDAASLLVKELLSACRDNDGQRGGQIVQFVHDSRDIDLLTMIFSILAAQVVTWERGGFQVKPESLANLDIVKDSEPWVISATDQMVAAAENRDYETFGAIAVDAHVRAIQRDRELHGDAVTFNYVANSMRMINHPTLASIAAVSLLRLADQ